MLTYCLTGSCLTFFSQLCLSYVNHLILEIHQSNLGCSCSCSGIDVEYVWVSLPHLVSGHLKKVTKSDAEESVTTSKQTCFTCLGLKNPNLLNPVLEKPLLYKSCLVVFFWESKLFQYPKKIHGFK